MAEIAFVVRAKNTKASALGNGLKQGRELARLIAVDMPNLGRGDVELLSVLASDSHLVPDVYVALSSSGQQPLAALTGRTTITRQTIAGGAAGNLTLGTAVALTDTIVAVVSVDDTTHVGTDLTSQFTITGTTTINNTAGTATTGGHVVVVTQAQ